MVSSSLPAHIHQSSSRYTYQPVSKWRARLVAFFVTLAVVMGYSDTTRLMADNGPVHSSVGVSANQWQVIAVQGDARYRNGHNAWNHWRQVVVGTVVQPNGQLETLAGGRVVLAHGEDRITTSAGSRMEIPVPEPDSMVTRIVQTLGSIFYSVETRPMAYGTTGPAKVTKASLTQNGGRNWTPLFIVQTPYLVAGVKGTAFGVSVDNDNEAAAVAVTEGTVAVAAEGDVADGVDVNAGQTAASDNAANGTVSVSATGRSASNTSSSKAAKSAAAAAKDAAKSLGGRSASLGKGKAVGKASASRNGRSVASVATDKASKSADTAAVDSNGTGNAGVSGDGSRDSVDASASASAADSVDAASASKESASVSGTASRDVSGSKGTSAASAASLDVADASDADGGNGGGNGIK